MVAPPKLVTFADGVTGGSGGGAGSTLPRDGTNIYCGATPPPTHFPPPIFGTPQSFKPLSGPSAAWHQSPFTSNPAPSFGSHVFPANQQHPFSGGNVQPAAYLRPTFGSYGVCQQSPFGAAYPGSTFGQYGACQQSLFGGGNVQPTTSTPNVFGSTNQQIIGTSGQASTALFGAPQTAYVSNCSRSNWGNFGQVSATSNSFGSSSFAGGGQAFGDNQQEGSRKCPYSPTVDFYENGSPFPNKLISISAMKVYSDKSHEELRLEDYQHQSSQGTSVTAAENSTNMSNCSFLFPAPLSFTSASQPSISASTSTAASGSSTVAPLSSTSASTSSSVIGKCTGPPLFSVSPSTSTFSTGHFTSMSNQSGMFPADSCSSGIPTIFHACHQHQLPPPYGINTREPDDTCVPKGLEIIVDNLGFNPWSQGKDNANKLASPVVGGILSCIEAYKDEDVIGLAEFAVEQHKALHKDVCTAALTKVVVACLEPFEGGRYHIVLDTMNSGPGFMPPKRHYAVVLRKSTSRGNQLTVLEKWMSS